MAEELEQMLAELEIDQLKDLAQKYGIDCSGCVRKEEFIATILSSLKGKEEDLKSILGTGPKMYKVSEADSVPKFAEAEQLLRETKNIFDSGDYINTIDKATEAIDLGAKALNTFYGIGLSYAIRSSENMISTVKDAGIDSTSLEQVLGMAKQSYENKEYESVGSIIGQIKDAMSDLYKKHVNKINELIEATQVLVEDAKAIGSDVSEAEEKLNNARDMLASESLPMSLDNINESEALVKTAKQNRVQEISAILTKVGEIIEEAKYVNAPVSEAESLLESARNAFSSEAYNLAIENANKASEVANAARDEQIQRVISIQEKIKPAEAEETETEVQMITEPAETFEAEEELISEAEERIEEPTLTELANVCPKCEGEPTYVEQYQRYYCYTCSDYIEPIEKPIEEKIEEVTKPIPEEMAKVCPTCEGEPTYVEQYQRYYCYTCGEYVEPTEKKVEEKPKPAVVTKVCPTCEGEPTYVEQYKKYYCYTCSEYVEPTEKKVEEKPKPAAKPKLAVVTKVCPTCNGEPTYVEQYQRYYCYTCSEYVEPTEKKAEEKPKPAAKPKPTKAAKVCPNCNGEPTYVEQYKKYYCYTCSEYVEPTEKRPSAKTCSTCGGEPTYVDQYKRYYCYTCSKYL